MIEARCVNSNLLFLSDNQEVKGAIAEVAVSVSEDLLLGRRRISAGLSHFYVERCRAVYLNYSFEDLAMGAYVLISDAFTAAMTCVMAAFLLKHLKRGESHI